MLLATSCSPQRSTSRLWRACWRSGKIEQSGRLIDDAIRLVEQGGDHLYMPELLRMKGRVLLALPEPDVEKAEACLVRSLDLGRRKGAKAWELRAAVDLAKRLAVQDRQVEAKRLLRSALRGFAEGSEIAGASRLLETL